MAKKRWSASYPFVRIPAPPAARDQGFDFILTPVLKVEIANIAQREKFFAIVDSGADFSYLPHAAAKILSLEPERLVGPAVENQGIGGRVQSKFATLRISILDDEESPEFSVELPFLVPLREGPEAPVVLLGRHPLFRVFDIRFRMGYTNDPSLGKWSLDEAGRRRDARRYRKPAAMPGYRRDQPSN